MVNSMNEIITGSKAAQSWKKKSDVDLQCRRGATWFSVCSYVSLELVF